MESFLETFLNCQVKFTLWRWRQSKEFDALIWRDNYLVDLKMVDLKIGFGLFLWKGVKICKSFWGYYWTLIFKGKGLVWIHPVSRDTMFGLLDHLKLHNYSGAIHPCMGYHQTLKRVFPKQKNSSLKWPVFRNLDHI